MCFVGFNSVPNLIVILFNLLYLVFIVGFNCKSCVIEKERVWRLKHLKTKEFFAGSSRLSIPRNDACALHMTGMRRVKTDGDSCVSRPFRETLASKAFPRDTRKTFCFARLSFLIHTFYAYTIYTHITHRCWGVLQREKPSRKLWELEIVIPTYLYTFACGFSLTPTSPFSYPWKVDSSNTYHTLSECQMRIWCY